jgi:hypothetical protein
LYSLQEKLLVYFAMKLPLPKATPLAFLALLFTVGQPIAAADLTLPIVRGIQFDRVKLVPSEKTRDLELERAIKQALGQSSQPWRYAYNRVNLNGDRTPETVVYLVGQGVCGSGGCTTMVFQTVGKNYRLVSRMSVSRQPLIVTLQKTNGWNDLVMLASGGGVPSNYFRLKFDGKTYPISPYEGVEVPARSAIVGTAVLTTEEDLPSSP